MKYRNVYKGRGDFMVNWYYVVGSDRVGPVSVEALKVLFDNNKITTDTYVWKKGFQNWERLKDVSELDFTTPRAEPEPIIIEPLEIKEVPRPAPASAATASETRNELEFNFEPEPEPVRLQEKSKGSPEVKFTFDWNHVKENEEMFFIKIGKDRKLSTGSDIYGPYSLIELREALKEKRINLQSQLFTPGMSSWTKLEDTILNEKYKGLAIGSISLSEVPLVMVIDFSPLPLITVVKKAGTKEGILLGSGPFSEFQNTTVKASLYVGNELKVKNVNVKIQSYDKKDQSIDCEFIDLNIDAKKIMLNHAV